jgi:RNA polymerase sigma-70 factor, ECF subfamily
MNRPRATAPRAFVEAAGLDTISPVEIEALHAAITRARTELPAITITDESAASALGLAVVTSGLPVEDALKQLRISELILVRACLEGDPPALQRLVDEHLSRTGVWIHRIDRRPEFIDDVRQEAFHRLVADGEQRAQLWGFSGRGALGAFVRVFITRLALRMRRSAAPREWKKEPTSLGVDPELALLRTRYAREFADAFKATLALLPVDDRNILRMHYIDGLTLEQVAVAYAVSRATAARALARARAHVVSETEARLADRLGQSVNAASLFALVESQLGASVMLYLRK